MVQVVEELMNLPSDFWAHYINVEMLLPIMKTPEMRNTPSSASLNRNFSSASRFFNTPLGTGRYVTIRFIYNLRNLQIFFILVFQIKVKF